MRKLKRLLRPLKDPRADNTRHDLLDIVIIALAATLAGARSCTEFEFFGHGRLELLRRFLELRHGIPSHDTFSNVLRALDPKGLETVLRKFSKGFAIKGVVSIDGKALRGAFTRGRKATPLHMVNVWAAGMRMALAQRKAPNRNEIAGALEVLALLDLDGAFVTADALHCRPDTAQAIRNRKGHYVLAIKSNRGKLFKAVGALLDKARRPARASQRQTIAHGRVERNRLSSSRHQSWRNNTASPASLPSVALTAGAPTGARPPSTRSDTFLPRACCQPRSCSRSCAPTGASRTTFTGFSTSCLTRTPAAAARITRRKISRLSVSWSSTSWRPHPVLRASATKCSRPSGITTSFSQPSAICDSPTLEGEGRLTWSAAKCETGWGDLSTRALLDAER